MDEIGLLFAAAGLATGLFGVVLGVAVAILGVERAMTLGDELRRIRARLDALESRPAVAAPSEGVRVEAPVEAGVSDAPAAEPDADAQVDAAASAGEPIADAAAPGPVDGAPEAPPEKAPSAPKPAPRPAFVFPSPERIAVFLAASVGGLALLFGGLFALVAVLESGLLGPALRVCLGLIGGTVLWVVGAALRGRVRFVGSALEGAGMGVLYGALFAAHGYYRLLGPLPTFGLMAAIASVAALRAAVHTDRFMAWLGLVGGLLAPVLVSTGNNGAVGLFAYLSLLLAGNAAIATKRRWPDITLGASLGAAALYLGWTVAWYGVDSVWIALLAAFALQVPLAASAALVGTREGESAALRHVLIASGVVGAAFFPVLALPWVYAMDATFVDPRSGLQIVQLGGPTRILGAVALSALPVPLWLAGRVRGQALISAVPSLAVGALIALWAGSWATMQGGDAVLLAGAVAPLAVGLVVHVAARRTGAALLLVLPALALVLAVAPALDISGGLYAAGVVAVVLLCAVGAFTSGPGALSTGAVLTVAFSLFLAAEQADSLGSTWVLGATLVALGGLSAPPLLRRWSSDRLPSVPWLGALLSGPAVFPALYVLWEDGWGVGFIGLLPALLGVHGLIVSAVLVRGYRQPRHSPLLALAVAVAVLGATFALPVQFQEKWLTVGWALEGFALAALSGRVRHPLLRWGSVALGLVIGVRLLLNPYALAYGDTTGWPVLNWTLYTWGVPTLALVGSAWFVGRSAPTEGRNWLGWAPTALYVLAMLTGFALVNVEVSHAFQDAGPVELGGATMLQGMVRSLGWASWGLFLLVLGVPTRSRVTRFVGFAFLMLAAGKVFVYDIYSLPGFVRVGSFIGLGVLLIISALLFDRIVMRAGDPQKPEGA
ncbi:MAG: DUF2339 domain-containing protein [Alphaproteobacteria bacterium]|nr:DUF2339 domain-containing protein [Alphaproteobacteria bacterium]